MRDATYVVYAFLRVADEVVDDPDGPPPAEARRRLRAIRAAALGETPTDDPVLVAFADLRTRLGIPDAEVETFVAAMLADTVPGGYETYEDLEGYLRGSSVAVANMMLAVFEPDDRRAAEPHARALAEAFQLTNFLRDVREDVRDNGRVYLPRETLRRFDGRLADVEALRPAPGIERAVRHELRRAERRYRAGVAGIGLLPREVQFPVLLAAVLYAEHHRLIRGRGYDVLSSRPTLGPVRRAVVLARTWLAWRRSPDPVTVFEAVSAVPASPVEGDRRARRPLFARLTGWVPRP